MGLEGRVEGRRNRRKRREFFFLLNISPWFCQSVLIQPFCFLADSSTIPSEMLIWQLSATASAFPSLESLYLLLLLSLSRSAQKQSSVLANLKYLQSYEKVSGHVNFASTERRKKKHRCILLNTTPCHNSPTQWPFFVSFWKNQFQALLAALRLDESYNFCCFSELTLTVLSVYLYPQGAH